MATAPRRSSCAYCNTSLASSRTCDGGQVYTVLWTVLHKPRRAGEDGCLQNGDSYATTVVHPHRPWIGPAEANGRVATETMGEVRTTRVARGTVTAHVAGEGKGS